MADADYADDSGTRWDTSLTSVALSRLTNLARKHRPEIDEGAPVLIGAGISTLAYGLSSPNGEWVLRISRQHPMPWSWRGGRAHEVELLAELGRRGVPVPDEATVIEEVDGQPTAIMERRVVGKPLAADLVASDPRLTTQIAAMLDRLHAVDGAVTDRVPHDDPIAEFRQALGSVDLADDDLQRRVEAALTILEDRVTIRALCHRDFRVEHLVVADNGALAGLLDLGEVGVDDPAVDLAFLHGEIGEAVVAEICGKMQTADDGLGAAARAFWSLWPLLELAPGGELWGDPATARSRLDALV